MAEAVVMVVFFSILSILQFREQRLVVIKIHKSMLKKVISFGLAIAVLFVFWPSVLSDQIKLIVFALLITSFGLYQEGLGETKLIKTGFLDSPYKNFKSVSIEEAKNNRCFLTFYTDKKNNTTSFFVNDNARNVERFFKKVVNNQLRVERL